MDLGWPGAKEGSSFCSGNTSVGNPFFKHWMTLTNFFFLGSQRFVVSSDSTVQLDIQALKGDLILKMMSFKELRLFNAPAHTSCQDVVLTSGGWHCPRCLRPTSSHKGPTSLTHPPGRKPPPPSRGRDPKPGLRSTAQLLCATRVVPTAETMSLARNCPALRLATDPL